MIFLDPVWLTIRFEVRPTGFIWDKPTYAIKNSVCDITSTKVLFHGYLGFDYTFSGREAQSELGYINYVHK